MIPTDQQIAESRARVGIPDDWEWFECSAQCGDLVWCPPGVGDLPIGTVCSTECAMTLVQTLSQDGVGFTLTMEDPE